MLTQNNKRNYIVEGSALEFYMSQGMVLRKVHKKLRVLLKPWLKSYIEFNIEKRTEAKRTGNTAASEFFKLLNNSMYG